MQPILGLLQGSSKVSCLRGAVEILPRFRHIGFTGMEKKGHPGVDLELGQRDLFEGH